jgi:hypothetical protein
METYGGGYKTFQVYIKWIAIKDYKFSVDPILRWNAEDS